MQEVNSVYDASFEDIKKFEKFMTYLQVKTWRLCRKNKERIEKTKELWKTIKNLKDDVNRGQSD